MVVVERFSRSLDRTEVESIDRQFSVNEKFDINEIILGSVFDFSDKKIASVDIALVT